MSAAAVHIARFNALQGKAVSRSRINEMLREVDGVAGAEEVATRLAMALKAMGKRKGIDRLEFTPIALPKAAPATAKPAPAPVRRKIAKTNRKVKAMPVKKRSKLRTLSGISKGSDLKGLTFTRIQLDPEYRQIFGPYIYSDTQIGIYGAPGHGKTVFLLKLAKAFAYQGLKTLYISKEEYGRSTFTEKINQFDIDHEDLDFAGDLSKVKITDYQVVFLDSVNKLGFTLSDYEQFVERNGPRIYVVILQTNKAGDFKGGQEWEHEVDIFGEVVNRRLVLRKNRYDSSFAAKSEQADMDYRLAEAKKRKEIRDKVKSELAPAPAADVQPQ